MEILSVVLLLFLGILGGTVAGFLGVGGGIIFVPIYAELFSKYDIADDRIAAIIIANSACLTFFSAVSGSLKQAKNSNFYLKPVIKISFAGIVSSVLFSYLIASSSWYNKRSFSIVFSCLLLLVVLKVLKKKKQPELDTQDVPKNPLYKFTGIGIAAGAVAAFSGLGGGIVMVPLLASWANLSLKKATSISLGAIMFLSTSIIIYYLFFYKDAVPLPWSQGAISFYYLLFLIPGVVMGAPVGVQLAKKASEKIITGLFLLFVLIVLVKTLFFNS